MPAASTAASSSVSETDRGRRETTGPGLRDGGLLPKVLLAVGVGLAAYLVFSVLVGLLMMLLMVVGGAALLYGAFRVGRWQGRRDAYDPARDSRRAVPSVYSAVLRQFRRGRGRGSRQDG